MLYKVTEKMVSYLFLIAKTHFPGTGHDWLEQLQSPMSYHFHIEFHSTLYCSCILCFDLALLCSYRDYCRGPEKQYKV